MPTIRLDKKHGTIEGPLRGPDFDTMRGMPGRTRWKDRVLYFEPTAANLEYLRTQMPHAVWTENIQDRVHQVDTLRRLEADATAQKTAFRARPPEADAFPFKTVPYEKQLEAFLLGRDREAFGFFMEMGTGKTKVALDKAAYLWSLGKIDTLFITAPNGVHAQWVEEQAPVHLPEWTRWKGLVYTSNWTKKWQREAERVLAYTDGLKVIAIHVEAFQYPKGCDWATRVLDTGRCFWALDESTRIKNSSAKRTKSILKRRKLAPFRSILSGAPITKGVEDLFTQLLFLNEDILGFSSFYTFRNHFCITKTIPGAPAGAVEIVGYKNLEELQRRLDGHTFRTTKEECLDLPAKIYTTRKVELTPVQRKVYKDLCDDLVTQLDNGAIVEAPLAIVLLAKLQQVVCGFLKHEEGVERLPNNRLQAVLEIAQETDRKMIIWARYHEDIDGISKTLRDAGLRCVTWDGRTKNTAEAKRTFMEDQDCKALVANPVAAGTGTDGLQKVCDLAVYYSNDFNADTRWQSEDRIHRSGMIGAEYIDLVSPGTIDMKIREALRKKKNVAESVMDVRDMLS